jgi:PAS domain S-box-containing protein
MTPLLIDDAFRPSEELLVNDRLAMMLRQERELQRRAEQQTVVADLGNAALRGESIEMLLAQAVEAITTLLDSDICGILQEIDGRFVMVGDKGFTEPVNVSLDVASMAAYAMEIGGPVFTTDLATETRFPPPQILLSNDVVSGIAMPVSTGRGSAWGIIGAFFRVQRTFTVHEIEFVRAIATVLAQAIERDRVDQELVRHSSQQSAIAELSRVTLKSVDDAVTVACNIIEDVLDAEHAEFFVRDEYTPLLLATTSDRRGVAVPVASTNGRFGALTAHRAHGRSFTDADIEFLQSLANILADAMEREHATRALAASEERYREVVEGASEIIFTLSPDGCFLSLNGAFEQITGWAAADWLGRQYLELVDSSDIERARTAFEAMVTQQRPMAEVLRVAGKHGEVLLDITSFPKIEGGRTRTLYGFARDISERRKLEMQLEQANRLTSLGRMAATIAHEFNNVLMGISPFVEVIRRGKSVETSLDHIARAVKRGKRITEEILRFTRSSQPQRAPFEVQSWIENIALEARSLMPPACRIETFVQSPGFVIDGDANQLQQIFTNLILNARDAMPQGGTLTIEVLRERPNSRLPFGVVEQPERFAHCIVRDTGVGMSAETLRHIYEPLFTTKKNGTGLGLPLAHQVVQRHGGHLFVDSTVGVGTAFHIFLPLAMVPVKNTLSAIVENVMATHAHHVLLVEDDVSVAEGLVSLLEMEGLLVDVVGTGAAAIRAVDQMRPDVVVLDVGLPDMEGTSVYDAIAAKMPSLPVIFSTGHADRARLDEYLEQPNVGYLLKPYESRTLLRAIEEVLPS